VVVVALAGKIETAWELPHLPKRAAGRIASSAALSDCSGPLSESTLSAWGPNWCERVGKVCWRRDEVQVSGGDG